MKLRFCFFLISSVLAAQSVHLTVPALDMAGNAVTTGTAYFTWPPFIDTSGAAVQGSQMTRQITGGTLDVTLRASDNAGYVYDLLIMNGGKPSSFKWRVPAAGATLMSQLNQPTVANSSASGNATSIQGNTVKAGTPASNQVYVWNATTGQFELGTVSANATGVLLAANNLSDVASASVARTNLGLGTAATAASSAFQTALGFTPQNAAVANSNNAGIGNCTSGQYATGTAAGGTQPCAAVQAPQLTGTLAATQLPAHTGDVTSPAGSAVNTLAGTITAPVVPTAVSSSVTAATGTSITVTAPASIANGNALVAAIGVQGVTSETWTPPTGFVQLGSTVASAGGNKQVMAVFCKIASNESGNYVFSFTSSAASLSTATMFNISGATCTTDGISTGLSNANTASVTAPSFVTAKQNDILIVSASQHNSSSLILPQLPAVINGVQQSAGIYGGTTTSAQGKTPAFTLAAYQSTPPKQNVPETGEFVVQVTALTASATAGTTLHANGGSAQVMDLYALGGIQAQGGSGANYFLIPNGGSIPDQHASYAALNTSGQPVALIGLNAANNIEIDPGEWAPYVVIGNAFKGFNPSLLVASGNILGISVDATQDLPVTSFDSSNNLHIGNAAVSAGSQENDLYLDGQTGKTIHFANNAIDFGTASTAAGLKMPAYSGNGAAPAVSFSAGAGSIGTGSTNAAGFVTSTTAGTVTFTLTWANTFGYAHGTRCAFTDLTTPANAAAVNQTAYTATTGTFTGTTASGDVLLYSCGPGF